MNRIALHWQIFWGMAFGAACGLTLNVTCGQRSSVVPDDALPEGMTRMVIQDSADSVEIHATYENGTDTRWVIDPSRNKPESLSTLMKLEEQDPEIYQLFHQYGRSRARWVGDAAQRLGGLFLRMLRMIAVPLIVTSLITGVMGLGQAERFGKIFSRTLMYYVATSMLAICTGLLMVNLIQPGLRGANDVSRMHEAPEVADNLVEVLFRQVESMIPANPVGALAEGNFLSIICFSLLVAIFALIVGGRAADTIRNLFEAAFEVMMAMTMAIIKLAPLGVLFLMMYVTATQGAGVFQSLFWYMLTVACALAFHALVTLPLILWGIAGRNPYQFAKAMSPALLTAFSSASSNGTLPLTLASVEQRAGVSNRISSFVLPLGATINMDGTALYEAVAVLFIAQLYHGEPMALSQQIIVAFTALLASIGAAGIPHAGLVMMVIILQAVGLPVEMQGIILAVDRMLDMCRTSVNVWSDSCGCAIIEKFETG